MRRNPKGRHLCTVTLDSLSVDSKKYEMMLGLFSPCFPALWHMLSFIASESSLAAIPWDFTISQWHSPHCTLVAVGISHAYLGLARAMLNMAKIMLLCWWRCYSHYNCAQRPRQAELDTPAWPSEHSTLIYHAEETEEKKNAVTKSCLKLKTHLLNHGPVPFTRPGPSACMSTEQWDTTQHKAALNHISKISPVPEGPQSHCFGAASTTFNSHWFSRWEKPKVQLISESLCEQKYEACQILPAPTGFRPKMESGGNWRSMLVFFFRSSGPEEVKPLPMG